MPPTESTTAIATLLERSERLYTLPTVALETLRLTAKPNADAKLLCECIQRDPAIAAKVLRAVNSPLYGLTSQVDNLPQAIALLGVEPLKLLVLGFALPERLFESLTGESLRRYWEETLATATAARAIANFGWGRLGDEAFVLGLMQSIGRLLLLGQFGDDYARLLDSARGPLGAATPVEPQERSILGFDHRELSAAMLRRWGLPERLALAIEQQSDGSYAGALREDDACLARSLRLATLLSRLVVGREFDTLPTLLDEADRFCDLDRERLDGLVGVLRERVQQVAQALSIELGGDADYVQLLVEAHTQLAEASQTAACQLSSDQRMGVGDEVEEQQALELLDDAQRLSRAVNQFLGVREQGEPTSDGGAGRQAHAGRSTPRAPHATTPVSESAHDTAIRQAERAAVQCRNERKPLSMAIVHVGHSEIDPDADALHEWIVASHWANDLIDASWNRLSDRRCAILLPGYDKPDANRLWAELVNNAYDDAGILVNVGVAGVAQLSRGFEAASLAESAERCLAAALGVAGPAVKGIELF